MFGGLFTAADADKDGTVTRQEFHATFDKWFTDWSGGSGAVTGAQLADGLNTVFPPPARRPRRRAEPDARIRTTSWR